MYERITVQFFVLLGGVANDVVFRNPSQSCAAIQLVINSFLIVNIENRKTI